MLLSKTLISPVLANLFLHYVFDKWMERKNPRNPWARYADDGIAHCRARREAEELLEQLQSRFLECGLELHPDKTRIVYCKDDDRRGDAPEMKFDFMGFTFRPRRSKNRYGKFFINFTLGVYNKASKAMRQTIRQWRLHLKPDKTLEDISHMVNPVLRGWINYYGRFYKSALYPVLRQSSINILGTEEIQEAPRTIGAGQRNGWGVLQDATLAFSSIGRWESCRRLDNGSRMS